MVRPLTPVAPPMQDLAAWLGEQSGVMDALSGVARPLTVRLTDLLASARPDAGEDYWPCMVHLVSVGRVDDALALLGAHDAMAHAGTLLALAAPGGADAGAAPNAALQQYEVLDALYVVLRQMPRFRRAYGGGAGEDGTGVSGREFDNMAEFLAYRGAWQAQCAGLPEAAADLFAGAANASPRTVDGVRAVLEVLSGDEGAVVAPTSHWLEWAVAQAVHMRPNLQVGAGWWLLPLLLWLIQLLLLLLPLLVFANAFVSEDLMTVCIYIADAGPGPPAGSAAGGPCGSTMRPVIPVCAHPAVRPAHGEGTHTPDLAQRPNTEHYSGSQPCCLCVHYFGRFWLSLLLERTTPQHFWRTVPQLYNNFFCAPQL